MCDTDIGLCYSVRCVVLSIGDDATRLDPLIMWGTGSHLGHTAVIMRYCHLRYLLRMHYQMSGTDLHTHYEMSTIPYVFTTSCPVPRLSPMHALRDVRY